MKRWKGDDTAVEVSLKEGLFAGRAFDGEGNHSSVGKQHGRAAEETLQASSDEKGTVGNGRKPSLVLLANAIDATLMWDELAYGLSADLGSGVLSWIPGR